MIPIEEYYQNRFGITINNAFKFGAKYTPITMCKFVKKYVEDSDLIDKQTAVNFCQHLLKDFSTQEVTLSDLQDFLNIK